MRVVSLERSLKIKNKYTFIILNNFRLVKLDFTKAFIFQVIYISSLVSEHLPVVALPFVFQTHLRTEYKILAKAKVLLKLFYFNTKIICNY